MNSLLFPILISLLAGLSTVVGSLLFLYCRQWCQKHHLGFFLGLSAGVMIYLSFVELLPHSIAEIGFLLTNLSFFGGIIFMLIIDQLIPYHYFVKDKKTKNGKLMTTGLVVAIGIAIHNFPEGVAVFLSGVNNIHYGVMLALAIAIHNIPEGMAVSAPIYHSTKSKKKAFLYSLFSGLVEPVGAICAYLFLQPYINPTIMAYIFSVIAGIMVYISFDELLPSCFENGTGHRSIIGIIFGMILMAFSLLFI